MKGAFFVFRIVAVVFIGLVGAVVIGRMAQQTIHNSTRQVSFDTSSSSRVITSSSNTTAVFETTRLSDHNSRSSTSTSTNADQTNETSWSIQPQQQQQQQQQIHLPDPTRDKSLASRPNTSTNATTFLNTVTSSTSTCKVAGSTLPAQFTNYSHHIVPHVEQLFDLEYPPVIRHTTLFHNSSVPQPKSLLPDHRPYVTCSIRHVGNWDHFAHTAQQLYRCWSLWQAYASTHQPVLIATPPSPGHHPNAFLEGLYATLVQLGIDWRRDWNQVTPSDAPVLIHDTSLSASSKVERSYSNSASGSDMFKGYKMLSSQHAVTFRTKILATLGRNDENDEDDYCPSNHPHDDIWAARDPSSHDPSSPQSPPPPYSPVFFRIGILNRQSTRRILNVPELVQALSARYNNNNTSTTTTATITVFELENQSFADQVHLFRHLQILIAPHGAGLVNVIFLPPCAGILELNPKGVDHPKFFGSLAALSSHHTHMTLYLGDGDGGGGSSSSNGTNTSMDHEWDSKRREVAKWSATASRRAAARKRNLCPNLTLVMDAVSQLEQQWRECCRRQRGTKL
jgi:hypothetical protein